MTETDHAALDARLAAQLPLRWRTRFAPAPTGQLHMGHAVNAAYVWSIARAFGGSVVLRIEDHDAQRSREQFTTGILNDLAWLGLVSDNSALGLPDVLTQRVDQQPYQDAEDELLSRGAAYACRCSRREIATLGAGNDELRYPGTCRLASVPFSETPARRAMLPESVVRFDDLRHGVQSQTPAEQCGDLLIRDRADNWTYQFAVVVDDLRHGIDLVVRGDDLLASSGRQHLLGAMLGRTAPVMLLHHPLVVHTDGTKLSKSQGDTGIAELRDAGWSAARVLGQAAWLGGLQHDPTPLSAEELPTLWSRRRQTP